jgi:hypothetical protein
MYIKTAKDEPWLFTVSIKEKRIDSMKKMTIAIAICTTLFLVACGKSSDPESSNTTSSADTMTEQDSATLSEQEASPAGQSAESTTGTPSEQAAFEAGGDSGDTTQDGQQ